MILNLKPLNKAVQYRKFKTENIFSNKIFTPRVIFPSSLDKKDAYLHVPIHPKHQKYLRFAIKDGERVQHFQYQALPFGLASAPCIFTKIMAEVMQERRLKGVPIIP